MNLPSQFWCNLIYDDFCILELLSIESYKNPEKYNINRCPSHLYAETKLFALSPYTATNFSKPLPGAAHKNCIE